MKAQVADCDVRTVDLSDLVRRDLKEKVAMQLAASGAHRDEIQAALDLTEGPRPEGQGIVIERGK